MAALVDVRCSGVNRGGSGLGGSKGAIFKVVPKLPMRDKLIVISRRPVQFACLVLQTVLFIRVFYQSTNYGKIGLVIYPS